MTAAGIDPRRCKHGRFFRGIGATGFDTYMFFPGVPVNRSKKMSAEAIRTRCFMTKDEQRFLTDEILLPALREMYPNRIAVHHPRNFQEAYDRSNARHKENTGSENRAFSELAYEIPTRWTWSPPGEETPGTIPAFCESVSRRLRESGNEGWEHCKLVTIHYGGKNRMCAQTLVELREMATETLGAQFNVDQVDLNYSLVDLAWGDEAVRSVPRRHLQFDPDEPRQQFALVHRTCCQLDASKRLGARAQLYTWHGKSDACSNRVTPRINSAARRGVLVFMQVTRKEAHGLSPSSVLRTASPIGDPPDSAGSRPLRRDEGRHYRRYRPLSGAAIVWAPAGDA